MNPTALVSIVSRAREFNWGDGPLKATLSYTLNCQILSISWGVISLYVDLDAGVRLSIPYKD